MDREEVIEAAMLANFVGSHLTGLDRLTVERTSRPANKINMEVFTAPWVGKRVKRPVVEEATPAVVKAYAGVNELALNSVPDIYNEAAPTPSEIISEAPTAPLAQDRVPERLQPQPQQNPLAGASSEDIEFIKKQLVQINTNLTKLAGMAGKLFASVSTQPSTKNNSGK